MFIKSVLENNLVSLLGCKKLKHFPAYYFTLYKGFYFCVLNHKCKRMMSKNITGDYFLYYLYKVEFLGFLQDYNE